MESIYQSQVRRTNKNLLLTNLIILFLLILVSFIFSRYYYNFFKGPFTISHSDLISVKDPKSQKRYFVIVEGDRIFSTGIYNVKQRVDKYTNQVKSETTVGLYELLLIKESLFLIYTDTPSISTSFIGSIEPIPADVQRTLSDDANFPVTATLLPFMLNTTPFRTNGYWGLVLFVPIFIVALWNIQNSIRRYMIPTLHPIYKSFRHYGDPLEVATSINKEFNDIEKIPNSLITTHWLIIPRFFTTDFIPLNQILWVYKKKTKHFVNTAPSHTTFEVIISTRFSRQMQINSDELGVSKIIETLYQRVPWIIVGYNDELKKMYRKNRYELINYVDQRREETLLHLNK